MTEYQKVMCCFALCQVSIWPEEMFNKTWSKFSKEKFDTDWVVISDLDYEELITVILNDHNGSYNEENKLKNNIIIKFLFFITNKLKDV